MTDESDASAKANLQILCFERKSDEEAFQASFMQLVASMQNQARRVFISEHNVLQVKHGDTPVHFARKPEVETSTHSISTKLTIPFKEIADNDLSLICRSILPINEEMNRQFFQNMYAFLGATAEKVGNVVDVKAAGSAPQALLEMLSKIELGVDRHGNINMPQIHMHPETSKRVAEELQNGPQDIRDKIEHVLAGKRADALLREAERKSKFRREGA